MDAVKLCMKYDTCRRCPRNKQCEAEYQRQQKIHKNEGNSEAK